MSNDGEKYSRSLKMQPCFTLKKDAKLSSSDMFNKCGNVEKFYKLCKDENLRKPYDKTILKEHESLKYFDFGGGLPVKYSLTYHFNYGELVEKIVKTVDEMSKHYGIEPPELIGEHGRFTVADHSFYIYKIDFIKEDNDKYWYIINGSLMNMTPDIWGKQQDFIILPIYKAVCVDSAEKIQALRENIPKNLQEGLEISSSEDTRIEFVPKGITKKGGCLTLLEFLGLTKDEMMAIGDGENDVQMFEIASCSVAMCNANETVKAQADFITDSNNDDGVAKALLRILGKEGV